MAKDNLIQWPAALSFTNSLATWTEGTSSQKQMNAAGEKFAFLCNFDGDAIESITIPLAAGTAATTINLEIQGMDTAANSNNVSAMPDGTAITNGTASVSSKGGTAEYVTWTFGTSPTPSGQHWVVVIPSGGSFDIKIPFCGDWLNPSQSVLYPFGYESLYTTRWTGSVAAGIATCRVKKTSGEYLLNHARPPFSTTAGDTLNTRGWSGTTCSGVKFKAPYDMRICGVGTHISTTDFKYHELVVVDSSDTELTRGGMSYSIQTGVGKIIGFDPVTLTAGSTYRAYFTSPTDLIQSSALSTFTIGSGGYDVLNLASGDWEYTTADDPPAEGGSGTWTDTATEIPLMFLMGYQDLGSLAGGGGGGGGRGGAFSR